MIVAGIALTTACILFLTLAYLRQERSYGFPWHGWVGIAMIVVSEALLFRSVDFVARYFTPIAWTGYILLADAALWSLEGRSRLRTNPGSFAHVAFWSVPIWLVFELYNLRLKNWTYVGIPHAWQIQLLGYVWAFATILPAIFLTAELILAMGLFRWRDRVRKPLRVHPERFWLLILFGAITLILPAVLPTWLAPYLFGLVWLGFFFLLEPINYRLGIPSVLRELIEGRRERCYSLMAAGILCGLLWEFWNYWATAKWVYIFPIMQQWKMFEMPLPGYAGFPAFALECFAMYEFVDWAMQRLKFLGVRQSAASDSLLSDDADSRA